MKNKAVKLGLIASVLPHLFCCVLPIVLSVASLFAPEISHTELIPEEVEPYLFIFSFLMLCLSWVLVFHECPCKECNSATNHKKQKVILVVVTVLFVISILLHLMAHH
ncbi:MAG: hypothetical protein MJ158_00520 [Alphaproteobacteria bacterium]|nr:hypothetical protein [Alphaproteobacteria bacterium]